MVHLFRLFFGVLLVVLLAGPLWAGQVYGWKDSEGNQHFTDDLNQVPAPQRERVEVFSMPDAPPASRSPEEDVPASPTPEDGLEEEPEDPLADCQDGIRREVSRWKKQLAEDSRKVEEITREIRQTPTARAKNQLQRERAGLNDRIEKAGEMLDTVLPGKARECRMDPDW